MAAVAIPNLPMAIALNGSEQLEAVQSSTSVRITIAQLVALVSSYNSASYIPTTYGLPTEPPLTLIGYAPVLLDVLANPPTCCVYVNGSWQYVGAALGV